MERLREVLKFKRGASKKSPELLKKEAVLKVQKVWKPRILSASIQVLPQNQELLTEVRRLSSEFDQAITSEEYIQAYDLSLSLREKVKAVEEVIAQRSMFSQDQVKRQKGLQTLVPVDLYPLPSGNELASQTKKWGRVGKHFKPVTEALKKIEGVKDPNFSELERAALHYLEHSGEEETEDDKSQLKRDTCKKILAKIKLAKLQEERQRLPSPPWDVKNQSKAMQVEAQILLELSPPKSLNEDGEGGQSSSYFLKDHTNTNKFIFKPMDGEFCPGYGFKEGGGASREVMCSVINDMVRTQTGLDLGVCPTSLVKLDNPGLKSEGKPLTGAIQQLAPTSMNFAKLYENPETMKEFVEAVPREDVERMMLLDFVTLQGDRNMDNIMVDWSEEDRKNGKPCRLIPIDAGFSMPSREGFEQMRRNFGGALMKSMSHLTGKKFSTEMQESIENLRPDEIVKGMREARNAMGEIDPNTKNLIDDQEIEIVKRSILFLKKASKKLTVAEITDAYAYHFQKVLDAPEEKVGEVIDQAIENQKESAQKFESLRKEFGEYKQRLNDLGWPDKEVSFNTENPDRLRHILATQEVHPLAKKNLQDLQEKIGEEAYQLLISTKVFDPERDSVATQMKCMSVAKMNIDKQKLLNDPGLIENAKKHGVELANLESLPSEEEYQKWGGDKEMTNRGYLNLRPSLYPNEQNPKNVGDLKFEERGRGMRRFQIEDNATSLKKVAEVEELGGDEALRRMKIDPTNMKLVDKKNALLQVRYEEAGGDMKYKKIAALYSLPKIYEKTPVAAKLEQLVFYERYQELGGDKEYVRVGGTGPLNKMTLENAIYSIENLGPLKPKI